jgi:hypothetical protein
LRRQSTHSHSLKHSRPTLDTCFHMRGSLLNYTAWHKHITKAFFSTSGGPVLSLVLSPVLCCVVLCCVVLCCCIVFVVLCCVAWRCLSCLVWCCLVLCCLMSCFVLCSFLLDCLALCVVVLPLRCLVLCCVILSCLLVLSCLILSYLFLSCLPCLLLSCLALALSCLVLTYLPLFLVPVAMSTSAAAAPLPTRTQVLESYLFGRSSFCLVLSWRVLSCQGLVLHELYCHGHGHRHRPTIRVLPFALSWLRPRCPFWTERPSSTKCVRFRNRWQRLTPCTAPWWVGSCSNQNSCASRFMTMPSCAATLASIPAP